MPEGVFGSLVENRSELTSSSRRLDSSPKPLPTLRTSMRSLSMFSSGNCLRMRARPTRRKSCTTTLPSLTSLACPLADLPFCLSDTVLALLKPISSQSSLQLHRVGRCSCWARPCPHMPALLCIGSQARSLQPQHAINSGLAILRCEVLLWQLKGCN